MIKMLIADDHPDMRLVLRETLQDEFPDIYIDEASDTMILLEKAAADSWDVVVTDLYMPGGGAFYFLEQQKSKTGKQPIVIVISMFPAIQYAKKIVKAGAAEFIEKDKLPFPLISALKKHFRLS